MSVPAETIASIVDELHALLPGRVSTAAAVREQHGHDESYHEAAPPDVVVFPKSTEEVAQVVSLCARHRCPMIPFGNRDVARRACPGPARRRLHRRDGNGRNSRSEHRGPRLPDPARGAAQAAQRVPARHRPVLPHRSGRGRLARRNDRDPCVGDERGALRDDAGERAGVDGGDGRWTYREDRRAGAEVRRRLRPHPVVRGLRGHPRGNHRDPAPPVRHPRGNVRRGVLVRVARRRGRHRHPDHPVRGAGGADRSCSTRSRWMPSTATRGSTIR